MMIRNQGFCIGVSLCAILLCATGSAHADYTQWQADPAVVGDWFDAANWTMGVPDDSTSACIDNGGTATITSGEASTFSTFWLGEYGAGRLELSGGSLDTALKLGDYAGGTGSVLVSGGRLDCDSLVLRNQSTFEQTGGEVVIPASYGDYHSLDLISGVYRVTGGSLDTGHGVEIARYETTEALMEVGGDATVAAEAMVVGRDGTGRVVQSGGTVTIKGPHGSDPGDLWLGRESGVGFYELHDGTLEVEGSMNVGRAMSLGQEGVGTFTQNGGVLTAGSVDVGQGSRFVMAGGSMEVFLSFRSKGEFDFTSNATTLTAPSQCVVDLGDGTVVNGENASVHVQANALMIFPPGFDPAADLADFTNDGVVHVRGSGPLVVPAGRGFIGRGTFIDPMEVYGTVGWSGEDGDDSVLTGPLRIFEGGLVQVGTHGLVLIDDTDSGMNGGCLESGGPATSPYGSSILVGNTGTGRFTQSGGMVGLDKMFLGYEAGFAGTWELTGDGVFGCRQVYVGWKDFGHFIQDGGIVDSGGLRVGGDNGGLYELKSGKLEGVSTLTVSGRHARFVQTGGELDASTIAVKRPLDEDGANFEIVDGTITAGEIHIEDIAAFDQFGGSVAATSRLVVGVKSVNNPDLPSHRGYTLHGGSLDTAATEVGCDDYDGLFIQHGGSHSAAQLLVGANGHYELAGGALSVGNRWIQDAVMDFSGAGTSVTIGEGAFADTRFGQLVSPGNTSLTAGANSVLMCAADFDPAVEFAAFSTEGLVYRAGQPLTIPVGTDIHAYGENERAIIDRVICDGTLTIIGSKSLHLLDGLTLGPQGVLDAGWRGLVNVDDVLSGMGSEASLTTEALTVGYVGTGQFVQTGGQSMIESLCIGDQPGSDGVYILDNGLLNVTDGIWVGRDGTGRFVQRGGDAIPSHLRVGGAGGIYELHDGSLTTYGCAIGRGGTGEFIQTGGTFSFPDLELGTLTDGSGRFELSGGNMEGRMILIGQWGGAGEFIQTGGDVHLTTDEWSIAPRVTTGDGSYTISGGSLRTREINVDGRFGVIGGAPTVLTSTYDQSATGHLMSEIRADGLGTIMAAQGATLGGSWTVAATDAPFGRFDVIRSQSIQAEFNSVTIPHDEEHIWEWGLEDTVLWVMHAAIPTIQYDPATGEVVVDASYMDGVLSLMLISDSSIFSGEPAQFPANTISAGHVPSLLFLTYGATSFEGPVNLGNIAMPGLTADFLLSDLTLTATLGGFPLEHGFEVRLVPEPGTLSLVLVGVALLRRRRA